jgi:hypothetical protein
MGLVGVKCMLVGCIVKGFPPMVGWSSFALAGFIKEDSTGERKPKLGTDAPTGDGNLLPEASPFPLPPFLLSSINVPTMTCAQTTNKS